MTDEDSETNKKTGSSGFTRRGALELTGLSALGISSGCLRLQESDSSETPAPTPTPESDSSTVTSTPTDTSSPTDTPTSTATPEEESYPALGNYPVEGDTVVYGFNIPQSGPYAQEGQDELRAYELAVRHLNNGGGWVDMWNNLSAGGVLGKMVDYVDGDTATDPDQARQSFSRMIDRDGVIMGTGGSSTATAIAQQQMGQQEKVVFMCCQTNSNDITGSECVRYGFREMFNTYMTGQALAPTLAEEFGEGLNFYQFYADYSWGQDLQDSMNRSLTEVANWSQIDSVPTPLGTSDYSSYFADVPRDEADILILNHYGLNAANSPPQARDAGLDEDMEIVVPLYNRLLARAASDEISDVYGTVDWSWQLENDASQTFTQAFRDEYDKVPSYVARLAYSATMIYSAAVERAETFYPPEVIQELEDWDYNQAGLDAETMRGCDHQVQRDILVVRGLPVNNQTENRLLEIVDRTSQDELGYGCDVGPAAECELDPIE